MISTEILLSYRLSRLGSHTVYKNIPCSLNCSTIQYSLYNPVYCLIYITLFSTYSAQRNFNFYAVVVVVVVDFSKYQLNAQFF